MAGFELAAEFHELGMAEPWDRLTPRLASLGRALGGPPRRVLEVGAGSGMGTVRLARLWPEAELVAVEPDRTMRSILMGRLAVDAALRERTTVLTLPVAPGTRDVLRAQIGGDVDVALVAHVAGMLSPADLAALLELTAAVLGPQGVVVITYATPHGQDEDEPAHEDGHGPDAESAVRHHLEEHRVGRHVVRGRYEHASDEVRIRYEQLDGDGVVLRALTRTGSRRTPTGEAELVQAAAAAGLAPSDLGWPGVLVLRPADPSGSHRAHRSAVDWSLVCAEQTRRLQVADPALGVVAPPTESPGEELDVIEVEDAEGPLWGILRRANLPPHDVITLWGPATKEILQVRAAGAPTPAAFAGLLERWLLRVESEGEAASGDRGALVRPLLAAGFAPQTTTALQPVRASFADLPTPEELGLRPPRREDREILLDLADEMVTSDVLAGSAWQRPDQRELMAHYVDELLERPEGWGWVAREGDDVVGLVSLIPPQESEWAAPSTSLTPVAYLGMAAVTARARGRGVGRRLVSAVHRQAARTGQAGILLDHATLSPLSAPFWHRQGYRPLWTTWLRPI